MVFGRARVNRRKDSTCPSSHVTYTRRSIALADAKQNDTQGANNQSGMIDHWWLVENMVGTTALEEIMFIS